MATTFESRTLTVSIAREADAVYQFLPQPANLPQWATAFCQSIRQAGPDWQCEQIIRWEKTIRLTLRRVG